MAQYRMPPDPLDSIRRIAPRTGPPVQRMSGFPAQPVAAQPRTTVPPPSPGAGTPGPQPAAQPAAAPLPPGQAPGPAPAQAQITVQTGAAQPAPGAGLPPGPPEPGPYRLVGALPNVPSSQELSALGTGMGMRTPHGDVYRNDRGRLMLRLNPEGQAVIQQRTVERLQRFGAYPGQDDPEAPPPPIVPWLPSYNPFAPAGQEWIE
jgi:hypothetical protein